MRFGIIDIGSNSIKLLIAESGSSLAMHYQATWETRIGGGLGRTKPYINRDAMMNGVKAIQALLKEAEGYEPERFYLVATSAVRDASNREEFIESVWEATGHRLWILSGEEEANYIAHGIMTDPVLNQYEEMCLIDLGGGSLECIHVNKRAIDAKVSLPLGAVRLTEECVHNPTLPMSSAEMRSVTQKVREALLDSDFRFPEHTTVLAGSGGALTVARRIRAAWLGRSFDDIGNKLSLNFLEYLFLELASLKQKDRSRIPHLPSERADIMPTALLILITVAGIAGHKNILHSTYNLRYGLASRIHLDYRQTRHPHPPETLPQRAAELSSK